MIDPDDFLSRIDSEQFINQRAFLYELSASDRLTETEADYIEGIINLLEHIADYCTDELGIDCIIKEDKE